MSDSVSVSGKATKQFKNTLLQPSNASTTALTLSNGKVLAGVLSVYCLLVALIFNDTVISIVSVWIRSETFAHGFLIVPISLWLAWLMRDRFHELEVRPEPRALLLVVGSGLTWLIANMVDVQVVQQLAFVALLISGIWTIAGNDVVRAYAFPLGFLFLAVPMGAELIPPLMQFTAQTTEYLVRASGIPVLREGMYLSLPSGTWSVIEECSGVRYLIASVTLGLCYAHLSYNSIWRKVAFLGLAILMPILANSLRAYALVMVGHLSDLRLGVGTDHLLFGWVLFGLVIVLMFWIGSFWQQPEIPAQPKPRSTPASAASASVSIPLIVGLVMLSVSIWPAIAFTMNRSTQPIPMDVLTPPTAMQNWQAVSLEDWNWHPAQPGADRELDQLYTSGASAEAVTVGLHLRQYLQQNQGNELVDNMNPWRPVRSDWRVIEQQQILITLDGSVRVDEVRVASVREDLLVWSWYWIDDQNTANPYKVKLLEAKQRIFASRRQGTRVFIATPLAGDREQAREVLQQFATSALPYVKTTLAGGIYDQAGQTDLLSSKDAVE